MTIKDEPIFLTYRKMAILKCLSVQLAFLTSQGREQSDIDCSLEEYAQFLLPRLSELFANIPDLIAYEINLGKPKDRVPAIEWIDDELPTEQPCMYIIGLRGQPDMFKIGITTDLERRISNIANGNPYEPYLVQAFYTDNPRALERALHAEFAGKRVRGEWFRLSDVDAINALDTAAALLATAPASQVTP